MASPAVPGVVKKISEVKLVVGNRNGFTQSSWSQMLGKVKIFSNLSGSQVRENEFFLAFFSQGATIIFR